MAMVHVRKGRPVSGEKDAFPVSEAELARFRAMGREMSTLTVLRHSRIAEQMGLSDSDHKAMEIVRNAGESLTAGRIAELTGLSTGAVTGVVDRLEQVGFVRRVRDPHDRRKVLIEPLPIDEERYAHLFASLARMGDEVIGLFSPAQRETIERYISEMLARLRTEILGDSRPPA